MRFTLVILAGLFVTNSVTAQDCMVSTNPPAELQNYPGLVEKRLDDTLGFFSAKLSDNDILSAKFGLCELSLTAFLLSTSEDKTQLIEKTQNLLRHVAPNFKQDNQLKEQVQNLNFDSLTNSVELSGEYAQHAIILKPSNSPLFQWEIHYQWLAPEH